MKFNLAEKDEIILLILKIIITKKLYLCLDYKLSNGKYEFYLEERIKFTDGDEIWGVFNDGTQTLRGVYNEDLGKFISK